MNQPHRTSPLTPDILRSFLVSAVSTGTLMRSNVGPHEDRAVSMQLDTIGSAYPADHDDVTRMAEFQVAELSCAFGSHCPEPLQSRLWRCIEAAWVLGSRQASGMFPSADPGVASSPEDPGAWAEGWTERLADDLMLGLRELGWVLDGSEVEAVRVPDPHPGIIWSRSPTGSPELRTTWIESTDGGRAYQWCVSRNEGELRISRRRRGNRARDVNFAVRDRDAEILTEMLGRLDEVDVSGTRP